MKTKLLIFLMTMLGFSTIKATNTTLTYQVTSSCYTILVDTNSTIIQLPTMGTANIQPTGVMVYCTNISNGIDQIVLVSNCNPVCDTTTIILNIAICNIQVQTAYDSVNNSIIATATGGTLPYSYTWSNGVSTTSYISNLTPGTYCVTVIDINGCRGTSCATANGGINTCSGLVAKDSVVARCDTVFFYNNSLGNVSSVTRQIHANGLVITSHAIDTFVVLPNSNFMYHTMSVYDSATSCSSSFSWQISVPHCYTDTLCGIAFQDINSNGIYDAGTDSLLTNAQIYLSNASSTNAVFTDSNGVYSLPVPANVTIRLMVYKAGYNVYTLPAGNNYYDSVIVSGGGRHCGYNFGLQSTMHIITGNLFFDANQNGVKDLGEPNITSYNFYTTINPYYYYNYWWGYSNLGSFYYVSSNLQDTLKVYGYGVSFVITNPANLIISNPTAGTTYTQNIGIYYANSGCELSANLSAWGFAPGRYSSVYANIYNSGQMTNAKAHLKYDSHLTPMNMPAGAVNNAATKTINWATSNIVPFSHTSNYFYFYADSTLNLGTPVSNILWVDSVACNDTTLANNIDTLTMLAVASFDPNEKFAAQANMNADGDIDANGELTYTINFQNVGNAEAINVVVRDTLSSNLDLTTFRLVELSHAGEVRLQGRNLTVNFREIYLKDSASNEPASHGHLTYAIKPIAGLAPTTLIENTAHIYFDWNEAVVTNTTHNKIKLINSIQTIENGLQYTLYPNPAATKLFVKAANTTDLNYTILNNLGQKINAGLYDNNGVDVSQINTGIYILQLTNKAGKTANYKFVKE